MVENKPKITKEEMLKEQAQDSEEKKPVRLFLEEPFREYVKEKYFIENLEILSNPTIMQMVLALEWYDIPRTAYSDLIEYHPYLTVGDYDKLFYINTQHRIENSITFVLFALISNRLLMNRGSLFRKRFVRFPAAAGVSGILTYLFNYFILRPIYLNDVEEMGLAEKYFLLDLNADMMKKDLEELGIKIPAKHFDLDQTESRVDQQTNKAESKGTQ